jgi:pimeloyl-ACP methyl ester carboxylesterase
VVVIAGAGDVASTYVAVESQVSQFACILRYDRSGLGHSERGPNIPCATIAARELHTLLQATKQPPPYLLVAHSYGGVVAREFLHLFQDEVGGMVLLDTAMERQFEFFPWPNPNIDAVAGNLNWAQVTGLRADAKLSREQWRQRASDIARGIATAKEEADGDNSHQMLRTLAEKRQLEKRAFGNRPLSVVRGNTVRDYERIYAAGVEAGNGTEAQRKAFRELLNGWDTGAAFCSLEQLRLSSRTRYVHILDCGHYVGLVRPDVVAEEVRWVLGQMRGGDGSRL